MQKINIRELINREENPKLDFKRQWYKEADVKTELIKDIIALTNGNIHTIGKNSFLIIGVKENEESNELYDVRDDERLDVKLDKSLDDIKKQLLQNLQKYATPAIQDIEIEEFTVDSKTIVVIQIPFHPYLIILKDKLKPYSKDTLLYRAGEGTVEADYGTRRAFDDEMDKYRKSSPNIHPLTKITNDLPKQKDQKRLTSLPPINTNFIGREEDLKAIEKNLSSDNVVCVVNGIGGVGKSELSYKYLHENRDKYNKIAFIEFTEESRSLKETFYFKFQDTFQLTEKDTLETIIKKLQGLAPKNLMVLDNLQSNEDFTKVKALNTNFDLLITTRAKFDSPNILNLNTLNDNDAKELFLDIYPTDEQIDDILKYLDNHPLFIKLIAFSLKNKFTRLSYLREDIKDGKIAKINSEDSKTFKAHLQKRFDQQFQKEENFEVKKILQILALLPAIEIDIKILEKLFDNNRIEGELQLLVNSGWLINKEDSYKLHQIIKLFMLEEYAIKYEEVTFILENIGNYIDPNDSTLIASQLSDYIPIIDSLLEQFKDKKDEPIAKILDSNTYLYYSLGEYENSLKMQKESLEIREELYDEESEFLAKSYWLLGTIYKERGEYVKAESFHKKALEIREKVLGEEHPNTASSYNNLAGLYDSKGEYDKAEPLYEKALEITEKVLGEEHPSTATSYNNLASLYESKGEYDKAEPLYKKDLEICEKVLGEEHPYTATSYNNLALHYKSKREYYKADPLYKKTLEIREKVLGEEHPDTASSYRNLGLFYKDRKLCVEAKEYLEKAIGAVEKLAYPHISLLELNRALKSVNDSIKKEKKLKFNKKGRFCANTKK